MDKYSMVMFGGFEDAQGYRHERQRQKPLPGVAAFRAPWYSGGGF